MLPPVPFTRERTDTTQLRDNAKNKAESTHETMGLVSAVVAGFEVTALVEVELCKDDECTGVEDAFIGLASTVIGLSTFILVEGALEYGFVVRELHYGHESAWGMIEKLKPFRKTAEVVFIINLMLFLLATIMLLHVRFAATDQWVGATIGTMMVSLSLVGTMATVLLMQMVKIRHIHDNREGYGVERIDDESRLSLPRGSRPPHP